MKKPNKLMINFFNKLDKNLELEVEKQEDLFILKNKIFINNFNQNEIDKYFPWHEKNIYSTLPYNPILIQINKQDEFINFFDNKMISILKNPTYVTFKKSNKKYKDFLNNIIYLPNLYNLNKNEINYLSKLIKNITNK